MSSNGLTNWNYPLVVDHFYGQQFFRNKIVHLRFNRFPCTFGQLRQPLNKSILEKVRYSILLWHLLNNIYHLTLILSKVRSCIAPIWVFGTILNYSILSNTICNSTILSFVFVRFHFLKQLISEWVKLLRCNLLLDDFMTIFLNKNRIKL